MPIAVVIRGIFSHGLVPIYRMYRISKGSVKTMVKKDRTFLAPLLHVNMAVFVFIALALLVIANNILIRDKSMEYVGKHAIIASLNSTEGYEADQVITDVAPKAKSIFASLITPAQATALPLSSVADTSNELITQVATTNQQGTGGGTEVTQQQVTNYTVQGGDTISTIAEQFGVSTKTVLWANGLNEFDFIKPGQTLKIPPVSGVIHQVASGDTLGSIARKYNVSEDTILSYNRLADASMISSGETLVVPGGEPPAPPAAAPSTKPSTNYSSPSQEPNQPVPPSAPSTSAKFAWPVPGRKINQYFGYRHTGVDLGDPYGTPIYAAANGVVETVQYLHYGYGYHVVIRHPNGYTTLYGHASKIFVKEGQVVQQGQTIALIGMTGRTTGPHLHFEVRIGGRAVNPLGYIR